jgi:hypothetical protein
MGDSSAFIECPIDSFKAFKAYRRCLSFNRDTAGVKAARRNVNGVKKIEILINAY